MEIASQLMNRALIYYIVTILTLIVAIIFCVLGSRKKDSMALYAIAFGIALIVQCVTSFIPFLKDYRTNNIVEVEAVYFNTLKDIEKSPSSAIGMYSVVLDIDGDRLSLTTVPYSKDLFPQGKHRVNAWYTVNSKWLLYIEVIDPLIE